MLTKWRHRRMWFYVVIIGGLIPLIARYLVSLANPAIKSLAMPDIVFFGLTMAITNLSATANIQIEEKEEISTISGITATLLGFLLIIMLFLEHKVVDNKIEEPTVPIVLIIGVVLSVLFSLGCSCYVNERVFKYNENNKNIV